MLVYAGRAPSIITFNWYLYVKLARTETGLGYMHDAHAALFVESYLHQISILSNLTNTDYLFVVRIAHGGQVKVGFGATRLRIESGRISALGVHQHAWTCGG